MWKWHFLRLGSSSGIEHMLKIRRPCIQTPTTTKRLFLSTQKLFFEFLIY
jgi:hypothetical protein